MTVLHSFPPIAAPNARILILGSMPGAESLRAGQYYAHPRNAFWPIMGKLAGAGPELPYGERAEKLKAAGIALWDVLASCVRPGSLDSNIAPESVRPNDFAAFFASHPRIEQVCFNGSVAEQCFRKHVLPFLPHPPKRTMRLPSTSPAHAGMSFERKLQAWKEAIAEPGCQPAT